MTTPQKISKLTQETSEDLCAQQVITTLPDVIKELVDNSIDAKSTYIKIALEEYGKKCVEIVDNGFGIGDFGVLGQKGTTSKNKENGKVDYLGFRGQALHSIGRVSAAMIVESRSMRDNVRRKYDVRERTLEEKLEHTPTTFQTHHANRQGSKTTGTKVTISNLFQNLPVRRTELLQKYKQHIKKINQIIKQLSIIYPQVQFLLINTKQGKEEVIIETVVHKMWSKFYWMERIRELFSDKICAGLVYVCGEGFQGYVLGKIESGSSRENSFIKKNIHYLFANRRPIDIIPSVLNTMNQIYKKYNNSTKYLFILNLKIDHKDLDINLSPNKRQIFIRKNVLQKICEELASKIAEVVVEDVPSLQNYRDKKTQQNSNNTVVPPNQRTLHLEPVANIQKQHNEQQAPVRPYTNKIQPQPTNHMKMTSNPLKNTIKCSFKKETVEQLKKQTSPAQLMKKVRFEEQISKNKEKLKGEIKIEQINSKTSLSTKNNAKSNQQETITLNSTKSANINPVSSQSSKPKFDMSKIKQLNDRLSTSKITSKKNVSHQLQFTFAVPTNTEQIKQRQQKQRRQQKQNKIRLENQSAKRMTELLDQVKIEHVYEEKKGSYTKKCQEKMEIEEKKPGFQVSKYKVLMQKNRVPDEPQAQVNDSQLYNPPKDIKKQNFSSFMIKGQFNKGFILCLFNSKLYLIDQHAASQKDNYQILLNKGKNLEVINCFEERQITAIEKIQIQDSKPLLSEAGFFYRILDLGDKERKIVLKLDRCPYFMEKKLGLEYFFEIVDTKREFVRLRSFNKICASKACKMAITVGDTLSRKQMQQVVFKLSDLQSPWNCPHGRSTAISVGSAKQLKSKIRFQMTYEL